MSTVRRGGEFSHGKAPVLVGTINGPMFSSGQIIKDRLQRVARDAIMAGKPKSGEVGGEMAREVIRRIETQRNQMLESLRLLVEMESPSSNKAAVDFLGAHLATEFARLGGKVTVHGQPVFGDHLEV